MRVAIGMAALCALFLVAASIPVAAQGAFSDVPSDHWAYAAVNELAADGLVIGYPDGLYKGNRAMTRYEFAMAISRIKEKGGMGGPAGPAGPAGAAGPAGPAGPAGAAGGGAALTDRQKQLLQQLEEEFMPELRQIRNDVEELTFRVEDLEAMVSGEKAPAKLTVSGSLNYRTGFYGSDLDFTGGSLNAYPGYEGLAKDAYKANNFGTMVTKVKLAGQLNDDVEVNVTLVAEPRTNIPFEVTGGLGEYYSPALANYADAGIGADVGLMDVVRIDEAWAKVNADVILPFTAKVGKQYFKANQGLALDNCLFPLKAVDLGVGTKSNIMVHGIYGQFDREAFGGTLAAPPSSTSNEGQDVYSAATLAFPIAGWTATGVYVHSGFHSQRVWSLGAEGDLFKHKVMAEFAQALRNSANMDIPTEDTAWVIGAALLDTSKLKLSAKYGQLDANFHDGATLTALTPYAAISPHDVDWADRPLFLDPSNIARGWEVKLAYKGLMGGAMPIKVRYYDGDRFDPVTVGNYVSGDAVWTVSVSKELAQDVMATLLYGQREVEAVTGVAGADPVQVLRGELAVKF